MPAPTPPRPPTPLDLVVVTASPGGVELDWDAVSDRDARRLRGPQRAAATGGPYATIATVDASHLHRHGVQESETYFYVVRAVDTSFNRSGHSRRGRGHRGTADCLGDVQRDRAVPPPTGPAARVHIAGFLQPARRRHSPNGTRARPSLTRVDATHWSITVTGRRRPSSSTSTRSATGNTSRRTARAARSRTGSSRSTTAPMGPRPPTSPSRTGATWCHAATTGRPAADPYPEPHPIYGERTMRISQPVTNVVTGWSPL